MAKKLAFDKTLFTCVVLLVFIGLTMVYSASAVIAQSRASDTNPFLARQGFAAAVGLSLMAVLMHLDYRRLGRPLIVYSLLAAVLVLLVAVLFSPTLNNTRRWFFLGGLSVQPSEVAKVVLVLYLAYQIQRKHDRVDQREFLLPVVLVTTLIATLVVLQPDLGTALLLLAVALLMVVLAGLPWRYLFAGGLLLVPVLTLLVLAVPYRRERILSYLNPEGAPLDAGFQTLQSLIAIGSGGLLGLGPGESLQKLYFLPQPHTDFIFAILAEELGLLGALGLLALFALLLWRGAYTGLRAPDLFGRYLAWGLTGMLVLQALANISVAAALLPPTGMPLPFVSYGGSSLVVCLVASGLLLNVSEHG